MGVFGKIAEAKYSDGGNYLKPGVYRLKVVACKSIRTRTQKDAFVVEFEVLSSSNTDHAIGSSVSWMVTLDKEPALGNIKQFVMMAIPCPEAAVTETALEYIVREDVVPQAMAGKIVRASAVTIKTKANRDFTKVKFITDTDGEAGALAEQAKG